MPIFRKHFDWILQRSKFMYVIALEWSTFTCVYCQEICIQIIAQMNITVNLLIWIKNKFTYLFVEKRSRVRKKKCHQKLHQKNVFWLWQFMNILKLNLIISFNVTDVKKLVKLGMARIDKKGGVMRATM